jgi:(p)ppGpp synthase/HD superfamily hydrolase
MLLSERFVRALAYAARKHRGQKRKGTDIPYVSHLLGVASIALQHGATEEQAIAALLHDVLEDQGGPTARREIAARFGAAVADMVDHCTDSEVRPRPPWRLRKEAYLARLSAASPEVRLVACADKLYNARTLLSNVRWSDDTYWARFSGGREGTLWYYRQLVRVFRRSGRSRLVDELARTVAQLCRVAGRKVPGRKRD